MPRKSKDDFIIPTDFIESLPDAEAARGFVRVPASLPSRHLRAAQAAALNQSVYRSTSKQERANQKTLDQKVSAQQVEDYLKAEGYIDENAVVSDNFEDPYVDLDKWRMHDTWRRDSAAKRAISILVDFILGQRTKNTLDANHQEYADEDQQKQSLEAITNNPTYQAYVYHLDCINRDVNFDYFLSAGLAQTEVFGRAMIIIQDDPDTDLPIALKLVSSMRLGRVFVDELTWKVVAVEYLDYAGLQSIIPAQKMIYLRNDDFAVSPNVYGFGYSTLEPILSIAETNRQLWDVAIKEINKSEWAPYFMIKMNTKRKSQMQKVADGLKPGLPFIHNMDITPSTIEMHHDLEKILQEIDVNERTIATTIGVPTFLMGREDVTNRATTATIIDAWSKSKLEKKRTWLRNNLEPQWIDRNLARLIESGIVEQNMPTDRPPLQTMTYTDPRTGKPTKGNVNPNNPFAFDNGSGRTRRNAANAAFPAIDSQQGQQRPQSPQDSPPDQYQEVSPSQVISPDTPISKLDFKVKLEFEPHNLDVNLEIAQPVIALEQAGIIDATKAREWIHSQDIEARMKEQEAQKEKEKQQMLNQFQQMKGAENNAMNQQKKQQQQQPNQSGGLKQIGQDSVQPPSLSADASIQEHKKKMEMYDAFINSAQSIAKN